MVDRPIVDAIEWLRRRPRPRRATGNGRTAAVVVNYNTPRLIAEMLFSAFRVLQPGALHRLVVVDNSTDPESMRLLAPLEHAGMIEVVTNTRLRYHGTGLNRGVSHLRKSADVDYVWVIDSDTMILRAEALNAARSRLEAEQASIVGYMQGGTVHPSCMLFDVAKVWRAHVPPFFEDGAPAVHMQIMLRRVGHKIVDFPFYAGGYALHLGTGTLTNIRATGDTSSRFHRWAGEATPWVKSAGGIYAEFQSTFDDEVGRLTPENLVGACRRPQRVVLTKHGPPDR